jgi:ketosteroid isomerase-like protein
MTKMGCFSDIITIKNGKIIKETDYLDQVAFLKQAGFFDQH